MPSLKIFTNLSRAQIPKEFVLNILLVLSTSIHKPVEKLMVTVVPDCIQSMNVDAVTPSIVANLGSIGHLGREENKVIAKDLTDFMVKELGVDKERIMISFTDFEGYNIALAGQTRELQNISHTPRPDNP